MRTVLLATLLSLLAAHGHAQSINLTLTAEAPPSTTTCRLTCPDRLQVHIASTIMVETRQAAMMTRRPTYQAIDVRPLHPKLVLLAGGALDAISTARFLAAGQPEDNRALQFLNGRPGLMVPLGLGFGAVYAFAYDLMHRASPSLANGVAGTLGAFHAGLAAYNFDMERPRPSVELINDTLAIRTHLQYGR